MGSKRRLAKELLNIILKDRKENQWYVEPFVGGANIIENVDGKCIGNDINHYLIAFWKAIQDSWTLPYITYDEYHHIKENQNKYAPEIVCHAAINCSYRGKWFGGYAKPTNEGNKVRDYVQEAIRHIEKQRKLLDNVIFINEQYYNINIPTNSIIYCDPPYKNTTKYGKQVFDYNMFYDWCRNMHDLGHNVFISEYSMPNDFTCVWTKDIESSMSHSRFMATEKLFTIY